MTQEGGSEVGGGTAFVLGAFVHALRAVGGRDVAEAALLGAGNASGRRFGRQPSQDAGQQFGALAHFTCPRAPGQLSRLGTSRSGNVLRYRFTAAPQVPLR